MKNNKTLISARSRLYTSVLLVLLALVAVTAATVAWFSIADNTKVKSMSLDIVSGTDLRMDLDPHLGGPSAFAGYQTAFWWTQTPDTATFPAGWADLRCST